MDGWIDGVWRGHTFFHWVLVPPANLPIAAQGSTKSLCAKGLYNWGSSNRMASIWAT
jgi:hypothetical protein